MGVVAVRLRITVRGVTGTVTFAVLISVLLTISVADLARTTFLPSILTMGSRLSSYIDFPWNKFYPF